MDRLPFDVYRQPPHNIKDGFKGPIPIVLRYRDSVGDPRSIRLLTFAVTVWHRARDNKEVPLEGASDLKGLGLWLYNAKIQPNGTLFTDFRAVFQLTPDMFKHAKHGRLYRVRFTLQDTAGRPTRDVVDSEPFEVRCGRMHHLALAKQEREEKRTWKEAKQPSPEEHAILVEAIQCRWPNYPSTYYQAPHSREPEQNPHDSAARSGHTSAHGGHPTSNAGYSMSHLDGYYSVADPDDSAARSDYLLPDSRHQTSNINYSTTYNRHPTSNINYSTTYSDHSTSNPDNSAALYGHPSAAYSGYASAYDNRPTAYGRDSTSHHDNYYSEVYPDYSAANPDYSESSDVTGTSTSRSAYRPNRMPKY